ncbi:MAG: class I SAM-dependent methyltransferase [Bdellovibrionales bacterium]
MTPMNHSAAQRAHENVSTGAGNAAKVTGIHGGQMTTMSPTEHLEHLRALSPVGLQYIAAIRGFVPAFAEDYNYAMLGCGDGETLIALAASNPDGHFLGFDGDAAQVQAAAGRAEKLGVSNVSFVHADSLALALAIKEGKLPTPAFDYVVLNLAGQSVDENEVPSMLALAGDILAPGGIFYISYDTNVKADGGDLAAALVSYKAAGAASRTDQAQQAGKSAGLNYLGSARIKQNYLEFSAPSAAHDLLSKSAGEPFYETLKDLATGATQRHDVWLKADGAPVENIVQRFGVFTFSVTSPTSYIDPQYRYFDKKIDFSTPLFTRLINALSGYPLSVGDMLAHEDLKGAAPEELLSGVMMLVATGIAEPTARQIEIAGDLLDAKLATTYNQRLRSGAVTGGGYLAAPGLGRPVFGTPTTLMCLKAIDAAGIKGAEEILDQQLREASAPVKAEIPANLSDETMRRNTAYHLLQQICQEWLGFTLVHGIMVPK